MTPRRQNDQRHSRRRHRRRNPPTPLTSSRVTIVSMAMLLAMMMTFDSATAVQVPSFLRPHVQDGYDDDLDQDKKDVAYCNGCWCVPPDGQSCPSDDEKPQTKWSSDFLQSLKSIHFENPMELDCDPYGGQKSKGTNSFSDMMRFFTYNQNDDSEISEVDNGDGEEQVDDNECNTSPPLEAGGACVAEIIVPDGAPLPSSADAADTCSEGYSYRLKTVPSPDDIVPFPYTTTMTTTAAGTVDAVPQEVSVTVHEYLTHLGACGTCSSFQDLAVYMERPDLAQVGIRCGFRALLDFADGLRCYREYGFSTPCAKTWIYDSYKTKASCPMCRIHAIERLPNNKNPPKCELADCIQCDEDSAGPIFKQFAGRTRRRSGLLSNIVRNCTDVPRIQHVDPCSIQPTMSGPDEARLHDPTSDDDDAASAAAAAVTGSNEETPDSSLIDADTDSTVLSGDDGTIQFTNTMSIVNQQDNSIPSKTQRRVRTRA